MTWKTWLAMALILFSAGWMLFDGTRALILGDYATPSSGEYAGQLGPWAMLASAVGVDPHSTWMKAAFVGYGLAALGITGSFVLGLPWARPALIAVSALGLWYLPIGAIANLCALTLLLLTRK